MKKFIPAAVLLFACLAPAPGQAPSAVTPAGNSPTYPEPIVRITVNLVQVDVVATDRMGRQVTGLTSQDFQIFEDGRPQPVTNLVYISTRSPGESRPAIQPGGGTTPAAPMPAVPLKPSQVGRAIVLAVDDLGLDFNGVWRLRNMLKKFVQEEMLPSDLVAVIRTSGGIGFLQQFTSDREQLLGAIDRIRFNFMSRSMPQFPSDPLEGSPTELWPGSPSKVAIKIATNVDGDSGESHQNKEQMSRADRVLKLHRTYGTLESLGLIVNGLSRLPGRKSVLLFTGSLPLYEDNYDAFLRLIDRANRAAVAVYPVDPGGLTMPGLASSEERVSLQKPKGDSGLLGDPAYEKGEGIYTLARETGAFVVRPTNDVMASIRRILEDQSGYYLIGYTPTETTFRADRNGWKFHDLKVKVNRSGVTVRTRSGFYGVTTEEKEKLAESADPARRMVAAISSPFHAEDLSLRMTAFYEFRPPEGHTVHTLSHLKADRLQFSELPDGWRMAEIELLAVVFGENGQALDLKNDLYRVRARAEVFDRILRNGLIIAHDIPVKKPGPYQLRLVMRDTATNRLGSAGQYIEVPETQNGALALSGIELKGIAPAGMNLGPVAIPADPAGRLGGERTAGILVAGDPQADPAVRVFPPDTPLDFTFTVYNPSPRGGTEAWQLETEARLFRDGKMLRADSISLQEVPAGAGLAAVVGEGRFLAGSGLDPGQYILQVVVTDRLSAKRNRTAREWIDFEIAR